MAGVAGDERQVGDLGEGLEAAGERQAEGAAGAPVDLAERVGGGAAAGVVAIDPVPGEVADRERRDAGQPRGLEPERRDVGHHQRRRRRSRSTSASAAARAGSVAA